MMGTLTILVGLLVAGVAVGRWTRVRVATIPAPVSEPVRIAVLADIHLSDGGFGVEQARYCLEQARRHHADLIVLVGDFVSTRAGVEALPDALRDAHAPLGVYAVLGNHDHWVDATQVKQRLHQVGIQVLENRNLQLRKGATRLVLVGVDDLWSGRPDWQRAFAGVPASDRVPVILLSHNPDAALHPAHKRAFLILSGHTHGGQVWVPVWLNRLLIRLFGRGVTPKTRYGGQHPYGLTRQNNTWVYITSGVTVGRAVPRWFTRPEIALIELTPLHGRKRSPQR
jgi:predicted MPP superfamily phosphohydrolase